MERHQGVPEPYIILDELVCDAIYDSTDAADDSIQDRAPRKLPPANDDRKDD